MARVYKDKMRFEASARCFLSNDKKKIIKASLNNLEAMLPKGYEKNPDLFPIAGNAFAVNLVNKNGHIVDSSVATRIFPRYVNHFVNLEHDQEAICGHITDSRLTKYSENYSIGEGSEFLESVPAEDDFNPYNVAFAAYIYSSVYDGVVEKLADCNDPDSPHYMDASFSFEIAFDKSVIRVGGPQRSSEDLIIDDEEEQQKWRGFLLENNGRGKTKDGKIVSKMVVFDKLPDGSIDEDSIHAAGVAITLKPAGHVKGIITPRKQETSASANQLEASIDPNHDPDEKDKRADSIIKLESVDNAFKTAATSLSVELDSKSNEIQANLAQTDKNIEKSENNISQNEKLPVSDNIKLMKKLKSFAELEFVTDEGLKEYSVASIKESCEQVIREANEKYKTDLDKEQKMLAEAQKLSKEASESLEKTSQELQKLKAEVDQLNKDKAEASAREAFNLRMTYLDETYELDEEDRKVLASDVDGLTDDEFETYKKKFAVLARSKVKDANKEKVVASEVQKVVAGVKAEETVIVNTPNAEVDETDKYKKAFSFGEGFVLTNSHNNK